MAHVKSFPAATRRICLRMFSDGEVPIKDIAERFGVKRATIMSWAQALAIKKGSKISDEDLKARMSARGDHMRKFAEDAEITPKQKKIRKDRVTARYGPSEEKKAPLSLQTDSLDVEEYKKMIEEHMGVMAAEMDRSTSIEGQVKALTANLLLKALRATMDTLPEIVTWGDMEKVINLLRKTLEMDKEKNGPMGVIDLRVINAKVDKRKVIEAVVTKSA